MKPHRIISHLRNLKPTLVVAVLLASFVAVCVVGIVSSTAQSTQDDAKEERKFENTIPAHVPLKVKLKNEQSFKNPKNKKWLRELEIEVKNTGSKPIYYLCVIVKMPELIVQGHPLGFRVVYGRREFVRITTPVQPDDVPILPGETVTLKVPESRVKGYEGLMNEGTHGDAKKVEFKLMFINFGHGTGLVTTQGLPYSIPPKQSLNEVRP